MCLNPYLLLCLIPYAVCNVSSLLRCALWRVSYVLRLMSYVLCRVACVYHCLLASTTRKSLQDVKNLLILKLNKLSMIIDYNLPFCALQTDISSATTILYLYQLMCIFPKIQAYSVLSSDHIVSAHSGSTHVTPPIQIQSHDTAQAIVWRQHFAFSATLQEPEKSSANC